MLCPVRILSPALHENRSCLGNQNMLNSHAVEWSYKPEKSHQFHGHELLSIKDYSEWVYVRLRRNKPLNRVARLKELEGSGHRNDYDCFSEFPLTLLKVSNKHNKESTVCSSNSKNVLSRCVRENRNSSREYGSKNQGYWSNQPRWKSTYKKHVDRNQEQGCWCDCYEDFDEHPESLGRVIVDMRIMILALSSGVAKMV